MPACPFPDLWTPSPASRRGASASRERGWLSGALAVADHGAVADIGEDLQQHGIRYAAIDDVRAGHATPDTYPLATTNAGRSFPLPMLPVFPLGEDSRMTGRAFEGKGDSQPRIQEFLEKACFLVRDHQGNRLTPHLMRSYPWGLPIHATIVIHYFLRRIRACCMDSQPASSLWIVPDFCEIWEFLPYNVGLHVIEFPTWRQPSPTRLVVDIESRKMQLRPCLQLLRELSHPLL